VGVTKVLGIVGSPKKNGNVDVLVSQVLKGAASQGAETHKVYLNDMQIRPCQSCGVDPAPKYCVFDDDMNGIYAYLQSCDVVVLGSPVYFDSVSAQTKLMIDRCNCLMPFVKRLNGTSGFERRLNKRKTGVFVAVAGPDQEFNTILTTVRGFFNWANIELVDTIFYPHEDDNLGSVKENKRTTDYAFEAGVNIVKQARALDKPRDG
jgi:multimeric flavodoxin WrbA